jgi:hypothetical protein
MVLTPRRARQYTDHDPSALDRSEIRKEEEPMLGRLLSRSAATSAFLLATASEARALTLTTPEIAHSASQNVACTVTNLSTKTIDIAPTFLDSLGTAHAGTGDCATTLDAGHTCGFSLPGGSSLAVVFSVTGTTSKLRAHCMVFNTGQLVTAIAATK